MRQVDWALNKCQRMLRLVRGLLCNTEWKRAEIYSRFQDAEDEARVRAK